VNRFQKMSRRARRPRIRQNRTALASLASNLAWGLGWTLAFACLFSLWVGAMGVLRGSHYNPRYDVTTGAVVRGYFIAALIAGLALGMLRPFTRSRLGATLTGIVVGPFVYGALAVALDGWGPATPFVAIVPGVLVGGALGFWFSKPGQLD
jgi:hypothetical protein